LLVIKKTGDDSVKLKTLNRLTYYYLSLSYGTAANKDSEILKYANEGLVLAKKLKDKYRQGIAIYQVASLHRKNGNFAEALKNYLIVLNISEEIGDKTCAMNQYANIGEIYSIQGNIPDAIDYCQKAVKIALEVGDKGWIFGIYNRLGNIYYGARNNEQALKYFLLGLNMANKIDTGAVAYSYINLGNVYKNLGNYTVAMKYYQDGLKIIEQWQPCYDCYVGLGWVLYLQAFYNKTATTKENYLKARKYFEKVLEFAKQTRSGWYLGVYDGLAKVSKELHDYQKALEYTELNNHLNDSLYNKTAMENISKVKAQYEQEKEQTERHNQEQLLLEREKATRERLLGEQKLNQEEILSEQKIANEKALAEEKFERNKTITEQKVKYEKSIAAEKVKQEKIRIEKQQTNNLLLMGLLFVSITSVLLFLYLRQRQQKKRAVEKAQAIHKMAELEMQSLRSQLNPHFMFNSLNSIQELILLEENEKSHSYLSRFGKLLRMLLENAEKSFIPLRKEIDFLQLYLGLENLRIPNLQYSISTDPTLNIEETLIPNMILQPYIENAIWHGLSHKEKDKQLQIRIYPQNGTVNYEIEDNGVGRKKAAELKSLFRKKHQSKGMELLSKRFKLLNEQYNSDIKTIITDVIKNNEVAGTLVTIKVPVNLSQHLLN
jgi:tetratricopeptide (TPR) repeat protein